MPSKLNSYQRTHHRFNNRIAANVVATHRHTLRKRIVDTKQNLNKKDGGHRKAKKRALTSIKTLWIRV